MKKRTKQILFVCILLWLGASVAAEVIRYAVDPAATRAAEQWRVQAAAATNPAFAYAEAKGWLEENGFRVIYWNPNTARGYIGAEERNSEDCQRIVLGQRAFRAGNWFVRPGWI